MLPAYVPNSVAACFGGGRPIDGGRTFPDGTRIFGDGKTYRGFLTGVFGGLLTGLVQIVLQGALEISFLPAHTLTSVILLAVGALLGDLLKSFFKRRLKIPSGGKWLVADQYDLVAGAFLLLAIFDPAWLFDNITLPVLFWIMVITPLLHKIANVIGFITGVKNVPW